MYQPAKKNTCLSYPIMPKVLYLPAGAGKTTLLIKESAATGFTMVVRDERFAQHIKREAKYKGLDIPDPITYHEFIQWDYKGKSITGFLIDDVADLLKSLAGIIPIATITIRTENDFEEEIEYPDMRDIHNVFEVSNEDLQSLLNKDTKKV